MCVTPVSIRVFHPVKLRPLLERLCYSVNFYVDVVSTVAALLFHCRPSAILFAVAKVIIDSVNSHAFRAFAHVFEKARELNPFITDRYPTAAIVGIEAIFGIKTPRFHVRPNSVRARSVLAVTIKAFIVFLFHAPARLLLPGKKVVGACSRSIPALAQTFPGCMIFPDIPVSSNNRQPRKHLPNKIVFADHSFIPLMIDN